MPRLFHNFFVVGCFIFNSSFVDLFLPVSLSLGAIPRRGIYIMQENIMQAIGSCPTATFFIHILN